MIRSASRSIRSVLRSAGRAGLAGVVGLLPLFLSACGGGGGGTVLFQIKNTSFATAAVSKIAIGGTWFVFLADEATQAGGTDLNGDGDMIDAVAIVQRVAPIQETNLGVATVQAFVLGDSVFLVVNELNDGVDWSGDGPLDDLVLLHWALPAVAPVFVDVIEPLSPLSAALAGGRLYYPTVPAVPMAGESTLRFVDEAMPTAPTVVLHGVTAILADASTTLLGARGDLLVLAHDETVEGVDLNGDADMLDVTILALLDGGDPAAIVLSVELPLQNQATPIEAASKGPGDWVVAFLVDEAAQSDAPNGLNHFGSFPASWIPINCPGHVDTDTTDEVLHLLEFSAWVLDPMVNPPVNTGLAGMGRVVATATHVGTLAPEAEDGNCDLNNDGDMGDTILRWTAVATPTTPSIATGVLLAGATGTAGGAMGLASFSNRWLYVVDEAADGRDHDGDGFQNRKLLAWLDPAAGGPVWVFDHSANAGVQSIGANFMAQPGAIDTRLRVGILESVLGFDANGDGDMLDTLATVARFDPPNDLDFPGPTIAMDTARPGLVEARGRFYFRVDEAEDARDWTGDGDMLDFVLWRTSISNLQSGNMRHGNNLPTDVVTSDGGVAAAFIGDEAQAGQDYNKDGDTTDFVVRWFRIGS